jgi:Fe-S-cluster-containing hydrogenase component 2
MKSKAVTCDLCSGMSEPSCVYACPHGAALRVDPKTFFTSKGAGAT